MIKYLAAATAALAIALATTVATGWDNPAPAVEVRETVREVLVEVPQRVEYRDTAAQGWHSPELGACWKAIADLRPYGDVTGTPIVCAPVTDTAPGIGWYDGAVNVMAIPGDPHTYKLIATHELGHAWDYTRLSADDRIEITRLMGWVAWDQECFAKTYQAAIGWYEDADHIGDPCERPTRPQLNALRWAEFLPTEGAYE